MDGLHAGATLARTTDPAGSVDQGVAPRRRHATATVRAAQPPATYGRGVIGAAQCILEQRLSRPGGLVETAPADIKTIARFALAAPRDADQVVVMFFNIANSLVEIEPVSNTPRAIWDRAVELDAVSVITATEFAVGEPSESDQRSEESLRLALMVGGVLVVDQLVVCGDRVVSFAERGWVLPMAMPDVSLCGPRIKPQ